MKDDRRIERLHALGPAVWLLGLLFAPRAAADSGTDIRVNLTPGAATLLDHTKTFVSGAEVRLYNGETLADGEILLSAVGVYKNPNNHAIGTFSASKVVATANLDALTDAEIEAALPVSGAFWTLAYKVAHQRTGTAVAVVGVDYSARSVGADPLRKRISADFDGFAVEDGEGLFEPGERIEFSVDAANIADGDVLTDLVLPAYHGRIARWGYAIEKAITTGAKTTTPHLEIGSTLVTGTDGTAIAGAKALGVTALLGTPTAANTFGPGAVLSIVAASTTTFVEGRIRIWVELQRRVFR